MDLLHTSPPSNKDLHWKYFTWKLLTSKGIPVRMLWSTTAESFFRIVFRNIFLNMKIVIDCQTGSLLVKLLWLSWWPVRLRLRLSMTEVWWETEVWGLLSRCYPGPASSSQWWVSTLSKIIWLKPAGRLMASRKRSSSRSSCINYLSLITCR